MVPQLAAIGNFSPEVFTLNQQAQNLDVISLYVSRILQTIRILSRSTDVLEYGRSTDLITFLVKGAGLTGSVKGAGLTGSLFGVMERRHMMCTVTEKRQAYKF